VSVVVGCAAQLHKPKQATQALASNALRMHAAARGIALVFNDA
jgi:hypothetical protein